MRIIACVQDQEVIDKILAHVDIRLTRPLRPMRPPTRGGHNRDRLATQINHQTKPYLAVH